MKNKNLLLNIIISIILVLIGFIGLIVLIILSSTNNTNYINYSNHFWGFLNSKGLIEFFNIFVILIFSGILLLFISKFNKKEIQSRE